MDVLAEIRRHIPPIDRLVDDDRLAAVRARMSRPALVELARAVAEEVRAGGHALRAELDGPEAIRRWVTELVSGRAESLLAHGPRETINATGILLHTGLGRAMLPDAAAEALVRAATRPAAAEVDLAGGGRGRRAGLVEPLLTALTGAEAATVVNNGAAALVITLAAVARSRAVVVSRGELVEIGGSFRLPEIIEAGGARLLEVGTTNRTRLADVEAALEPDADGERPGAILRVHRSNFEIVGFSEDPPLPGLVELGRRHGVPVIHDAGSGLLRRDPHPALAAEPVVTESIEAGCDLALFSGDKLLGGPQAGVIVGRRRWIEAIERHPLMRAMRVDKLVLAALTETLKVHLSRERVGRDIPAMRMLGAPIGLESERARALIERTSARLTERGSHPVALRAAPSKAFLGGGSVPGRAISSIAVVIDASEPSPTELARRLRTGRIPVLPRIHDGAVRLELRSVLPEQDTELAEALADALVV